MALKVELKPHERIIIGTVVIRADDQRTRLFIEGEAPILREKDILTHRTADTPAKRIYLAVQLMYLDQDVAKHHEIYFTLVREFLEAVPSSGAAINELNNRILNGDLYKALKAAKKLITYESELLAHVLRGQRLREDSPSGTDKPT
ncbi:MAG: flagellar biosynthesis repressor FlbT [Beijerinckiaceae bacterium]|jgi:flagellar protein FlbT|nr:flagellar biosynthesis repressor FlbT [Beijerinckiaceae bacterium]